MLLTVYLKEFSICISLIDAYVTVKRFSVMSRQLLGWMAEVSCWRAQHNLSGEAQTSTLDLNLHGEAQTSTLDLNLHG